MPLGTYLLDLRVSGRPRDLIETSASDFDLGTDYVGRIDAVLPSLSTPVTFDVDGLVPWNAQDRLELVSAGAGEFFPPFGWPPVTVVPEGAVRAAQVFDFRGLPAQRHVDAALGDEALLVQSASAALPGTSYLYQAAAGAGPTPPGFTVQDGIAAVVLILLFHHWSDKPPFLRDGIWICMLLVCCILLFGFLDELRDYYEFYPIVILLIYHSLCALSGNILGKIETFR